MTGPDTRDLLALDEPLAPLPPDLGEHIRHAALRRRRRQGIVAGSAALVALAGAVLLVVPLGNGTDETLSPAPLATRPAPEPAQTPLAEGEVVPELDVPPCHHPGGFRRIQGVPGEKRSPERVVESVREDFSTGTGYLPEVERALVDTAPARARVDCASSGTMVFLVGDDGSYLEVYAALVNPQEIEGRDEYFTRRDVETLTTPGGARVRLDVSVPTQATAEIWAGRYDVSVSSRTSDDTGAGLPLAEMRAFVDRLGDRLVEESGRRGEVPVEMIDRTPNPPPQHVVDRVLATAPEGAVQLPPDPHSPAQAARIHIPLGEERSAAVVLVMSTTNPRQAGVMTAEQMQEVAGAELEDETDGWPPGLLVGVGVTHNQILIQYEDSLFLNFGGDVTEVVSRERLRQWAMDVVEVLEDPEAAGADTGRG